MLEERFKEIGAQHKEAFERFANNLADDNIDNEIILEDFFRDYMTCRVRNTFPYIGCQYGRELILEDKGIVYPYEVCSPCPLAKKNVCYFVPTLEHTKLDELAKACDNKEYDKAIKLAHEIANAWTKE